MIHFMRERHGVCASWWPFGATRRSCIRAEFYWWSSSCGIRVGSGDEGWTIGLRLPPLALYVSLDGFGLRHPTYSTIATWDNDRAITLPDQREFSLYVDDWTIRFTPWGRSMEWRSSDPWWVRGVSLNLVDVLLGPARCTTEVLAEQACVVPMPEWPYPAIAKVERRTWRRARWLDRSRTSVWLTIPKGIPHAGKGENSYDCGDDGLFGIGGDTIEDAAKNAIAAVMRDRQRYGAASDEAMSAARAGGDAQGRTP